MAPAETAMKSLKIGLAALLCSTALANATQNLAGYDNGIPFTPTITATTYSSGQFMGGLQTVPVFRTTTYTAWIFDNLQLTSKGGNIWGYDGLCL